MDVLPHGKLMRLNERIVIVVGDLKMPLLTLPRRITSVRLKSGYLVIFSAIALQESDMAELEALGRPLSDMPSEAPAGFTKVRAELSEYHRHGAQHSPREDRRSSARRHQHTSLRRSIDSLRRTRGGLTLEVDCEDGPTLIVNDLIGDIHDESGIGGWLLRVMGFAGDDPHVPAPVKMLLGKHKTEVAHQFRLWAARDDLRRIIVSHGDTIDADPRGVLRTLASSLD